MWHVMIIPASLTHQAVGSNPVLDPERFVETCQLSLLTQRPCIESDCCDRWLLNGRPVEPFGPSSRDGESGVVCPDKQIVSLGGNVTPAAGGLA